MVLAVTIQHPLVQWSPISVMKGIHSLENLNEHVRVMVPGVEASQCVQVRVSRIFSTIINHINADSTASSHVISGVDTGLLVFTLLLLVISVILTTIAPVTAIVKKGV